MEIIHLKSRLVDGKIETQYSSEELAQFIREAKVLIINTPFDKDEILKSRHALHRWGCETQEQNPQRAADTINFHRIDHDHPKMVVKRIAHFFRFSYANKGQFIDLFNYIHPVNLLRNAIAGLNPEYTFYNTDDGFLSQPSALHYPAGGGYMQAHKDPVEPQRVEVVMLMSKKGKDFKEGGLAIEDQGVWKNVEDHTEFGDIVLFRPDIPHRVEPIDPASTLDWKNEAGRWILFSPIAHMVDTSKNEVTYSQTKI